MSKLGVFTVRVNSPHGPLLASSVLAIVFIGDRLLGFLHVEISFWGGPNVTNACTKSSDDLP